MTDALRGAACFVRGLALLPEPDIRRFALWPIAISIAVFGALLWLAATKVEALQAWLLTLVPDWLHWLGWLLWIAFFGAAAIILLLTFVLVVGVIACPFNGPLADAVERHLRGQGAPALPLRTALLRLPGDLWDEIRKVLYALLLAVPFLLLFVVPLLQLAAPALWFLFSAWITAFSFADYAMSNHGLRLAEIRATLRGRWLLSMGFGATAFAALLVPFLNLVAIPAAVAGGAVLWTTHLRSAGGD